MNSRYGHNNTYLRNRYQSAISKYTPRLIQMFLPDSVCKYGIVIEMQRYPAGSE